MYVNIREILPMARGPKLRSLMLSDAEVAQLTAWGRRPKTARALSDRARIILASAAGAPNTTVVEAVGVTYQTVGKWSARFPAQRLDWTKRADDILQSIKRSCLHSSNPGH